MKRPRWKQARKMQWWFTPTARQRLGNLTGRIIIPKWCKRLWDSVPS